MSNLKLKATPNNHSEALEALNGKTSRVIGPNTNMYLSGTGDVVVSYHGNDIVTYAETGNVYVNWCGWVTATTADRIHQLAPGRFNRKLGVPHHNGEPMADYGWVQVN